MKKFGLSLVMMGVVSLSCIGCGQKSNISSDALSVDSTALKEVKNAVETLKNLDNSYIVETAIEAPSDNFAYIEVNTPSGNYTEYPVSEDGEVGTLFYGSSDSMQYILMDLISNDGHYYSFDSSGDELAMTVYPDEYKDWVDGRSLLYVEDMLDDFISLEKLDTTIDVTLDDGEMKLTSYQGVLKSDKVRNILGNNNIGIYESLIASEEDGSNVQNLCKQYLKDSEFLMTFSDANVVIGVDSSGCLRYMGLETGGLGARMYYTKVVISPNNTNFRELPDTSNAVALRDLYVDTADYVAGFDSYEDAMHALNHHDAVEPDEFYNEILGSGESEVETSTVIETNEVETSTVAEVGTENSTEVSSEVENYVE